MHLAQFFDWRLGRSVKRSDSHLGCGGSPFEQVCIYGFGRAIHVVEYSNEPLKPEQVPGNFLVHGIGTGAEDERGPEFDFNLLG